MKPNGTKRRSQRLQKKMRVQAYKELYASWEIVFSVADDDSLQRSDDICDVLEWFGGYCCTTGRYIASGGVDYLARYGPCITHEIASKLSKLENVVSVKVSGTVDANYDPIWDLDYTVDTDAILFAKSDAISIH